MFFEPIYIPWAFNTGTCTQQGDLFILRAYTETMRHPQITLEKLGRDFGKMQVNGPER